MKTKVLKMLTNEHKKLMSQRTRNVISSMTMRMGTENRHTDRATTTNTHRAERERGRGRSKKARRATREGR